MRVVIDVRACLGPGAGVNVYTVELIKALHKLGADVAMWFAARQIAKARQALVPELQALIPHVPLFTTRLPNNLLYSDPALVFWRHWPRFLPPPRFLPREADVYHAPFWPLPIDGRIPLVLTIHDLLALRYPQWATRRMWQEQKTICAMASRAAIVMTDSEATRQDVLEMTKAAPERVHTVYLGVDEQFFQEISSERRIAVRKRYGLDKPYIVSLCTRDPRKNLGRLIDAYDLLCSRLGAEWDLVLIGAVGWGEDYVTPRLKQPRPGRIIVTGYVPREDVPPLLAEASCLGFVSLGEGFGLPPLEAMAAGCPVVASQLSSLPEVVGEAGLLVDPLNIEAIADGLQRVLTDEALAAELRQRGYERARQFTWERTARMALRLYEQAAQEFGKRRK